MKEYLVKSLVQLLINRFGLATINETLASIYYEKFLTSNNTYYDDIAELYDKINAYLLNSNSKED